MDKETRDNNSTPESCSCSEEEEEEEEEDNNDSDQEEIDYAELIEKNHLDLVTNIDLERQFLFSYLRMNRILDEEDCELIQNTGSSRKQKASLFLDVIKRRGENGMKHFIAALGFEHPELYKKITGNEPESKDLVGKDYIGLDRVMLARQYEHTVGELHHLTRIHKNVQEEKNFLEKRLIESEKNNKSQQEHIEELKQAIEKFSEITRMADDEANNNFELQAQCQRDMAVQQAVIAKTYHIIALQGKLLAQNEEMDCLRKELSELKTKNSTVNKQLMNVTLRFDEEKRQSRRLNEQVLSSSGSCRHEKQTTRELKLQLSITREENERLKTKLEELTKFSEVLNVKYNMVLVEKNKLKEQSEEMSFTMQDATDRNTELGCKLTSLQIDKNYIEKTNERLVSDLTATREFRKSLLDELEQAREERLSAWKASEELLQTKKMHDEAMHSQMIINNTLEEKYSDVCEQLDCMRDCLQQTKEELIETNKLLRQPSQVSKSTSTKEDVDQKEEVSYEDEKDDRQTKMAVPKEFTFEQRSHSQLLQSIKRKTAHDDVTVHMTPTTTASNLSQLSFQQMSLAFQDPAGNYGVGPSWLLSPALTLPSPRSRKTSFPQSSAHSSLPSAQKLLKNFEANLSSSYPLVSTAPDGSLPVANQATVADRQSTLVNVPKYLSQMSLPEGINDSNIQRTAAEGIKRNSFSDSLYASANNHSINSSSSKLCNPGDVYVANTIKVSTAKDYPPSKIHAIQKSPRNIRSTSTPVDIKRMNTFSNVFVYNDRLPVQERGEEEGENFRARSRNHVDPREKLKWYEKKKRSLSCPATNYVCVEKYGTFDI